MTIAIERAGRLGHRAIVLVGAAACYERFDVASALTGAADAGTERPERLLGLELDPGGLEGQAG